ncbi:hypothetical protein H696_01126 [Fonticula alba]|uniref:Uncharacterized protein n=1 Tax=Fonticula alba TaxID=691883 RepID=A0A058ZCP4_FONAL|nr:hypothetical protein H696_01126 [Fonticula alba]KCV71703.1 hypothetical protein H696_01126 [Fonticula alba]|eukprot:XP_009493281.1 hypothetical protein H696_01126 [Fonticula alba]
MSAPSRNMGSKLPLLMTTVAAAGLAGVGLAVWNTPKKYPAVFNRSGSAHHHAHHHAYQPATMDTYMNYHPASMANQHALPMQPGHSPALATQQQQQRPAMMTPQAMPAQARPAPAGAYAQQATPGPSATPMPAQTRGYPAHVREGIESGMRSSATAAAAATGSGVQYVPSYYSESAAPMQAAGPGAAMRRMENSNQLPNTLGSLDCASQPIQNVAEPVDNFAPQDSLVHVQADGRPGSVPATYEAWSKGQPEEPGYRGYLNRAAERAADDAQVGYPTEGSLTAAFRRAGDAIKSTFSETIEAPTYFRDFFTGEDAAQQVVPTGAPVSRWAGFKDRLAHLRDDRPSSRPGMLEALSAEANQAADRAYADWHHAKGRLLEELGRLETKLSGISDRLVTLGSSTSTMNESTLPTSRRLEAELREDIKRMKASIDEAARQAGQNIARIGTGGSLEARRAEARLQEEIRRSSAALQGELDSMGKSWLSHVQRDLDTLRKAADQRSLAEAARRAEDRAHLGTAQAAEAMQETARAARASVSTAMDRASSGIDRAASKAADTAESLVRSGRQAVEEVQTAAAGMVAGAAGGVATAANAVAEAASKTAAAVAPAPAPAPSLWERIIGSAPEPRSVRDPEHEAQHARAEAEAALRRQATEHKHQAQAISAEAKAAQINEHHALEAMEEARRLQQQSHELAAGHHHAPAGGPVHMPPSGGMASTAVYQPLSASPSPGMMPVAPVSPGRAHTAEEARQAVERQRALDLAADEKERTLRESLAEAGHQQTLARQAQRSQNEAFRQTLEYDLSPKEADRLRESVSKAEREATVAREKYMAALDREKREQARWSEATRRRAIQEREAIQAAEAAALAKNRGQAAALAAAQTAATWQKLEQEALISESKALEAARILSEAKDAALRRARAEHDLAQVRQQAVREAAQREAEAKRLASAISEVKGDALRRLSSSEKALASELSKHQTEYERTLKQLEAQKRANEEALLREREALESGKRQAAARATSQQEIARLERAAADIRQREDLTRQQMALTARQRKDLLDEAASREARALKTAEMEHATRVELVRQSEEVEARVRQNELRDAQERARLEEQARIARAEAEEKNRALRRATDAAPTMVGTGSTVAAAPIGPTTVAEKPKRWSLFKWRKEDPPAAEVIAAPMPGVAVPPLAKTAGASSVVAPATGIATATTAGAGAAAAAKKTTTDEQIAAAVKAVETQARRFDTRRVCSQLPGGVTQCLLLEETPGRPVGTGSRCLGVEYVIKEDTFARLPLGEKNLWQRRADGTFAKTIGTWPVHSDAYTNGDALAHNVPLGMPQMLQMTAHKADSATVKTMPAPSHEPLYSGGNTRLGKHSDIAGDAWAGGAAHSGGMGTPEGGARTM